MKASRRIGVFAAVALLLAIVAGVCAAEPNEVRRHQASSLLDRRSPGFDFSTIERMREMRPFAPDVFDRVREQGGTLGITGSVLVLFLLVAIAYAFFGQHRSAARFEQALEPTKSRVSENARRWISALAHVIAAGLLPLGLWALHSLVAALTGYGHPAFILVGTLLLVWVQFAVAVTAARELLVRPLLHIPAEHGRYLYGIARLLLFYGILLSALLEAFAALGTPGDVVAFLRWLFRLSLVVFLAAALAHKSAVMAIFPDIPNRPYRAFVRFLGRIYPLAWVVTLATAILSLAGYSRLAEFVWIRTWALAGVFVAVVFAVHFARGLFRGWVFRDAADLEKAESFYRSAGSLLDYLGVVAVGLLGLELTGLRNPLADALGTTIYEVDKRPVSFLLFLVAGAIVLAFLLSARVLRDYLDFQVYPSLNVEEGVAHAINTFVFYVLVSIGVLFAFQAIGLGLGSLAIFAGALGVGVGFGLQTIASNLASGLTLIFTRAVRRGDWVTIGDTIGVIQEVGIRATRLRTPDAVDYLVPNADFVGGTIVNWTHTSPFVRQHVRLGVSYAAAPEQVRDILLRVARESPHVHTTPAPEVWFTGFGESSLDFELLVWSNLKQVSDQQVRSDLYFRIFRAFKEAQIEIPFPQRDVHIRNVPPSPTNGGEDPPSAEPAPAARG